MKTNPTQCFTKKNEFGFALFGEPYYNSMATVNPMLIDDVKALFNNLQGDEKNA